MTAPFVSAILRSVILATALLGGFTSLGFAQTSATGGKVEPWKFAVSGDSRNCGDIVVPAIAEGVLKDGAEFYWHLGDYRAIYMYDEDYLHLNPQAAISDYETAAWPDFIDHQLKAFGNLPVFLGVGNHELIAPKTHDALIAQFADWFDSPVVRSQRLADNPDDHLVHTYYHWMDRGVDFINLDNSDPDQFGPGPDDVDYRPAETRRRQPRRARPLCSVCMPRCPTAFPPDTA